MWLLEITSPQTLYLLDSSSLRLVPTAFVDSIALLGAEEQVLLTCFFFKFYFYFFIFCKYFHTISCMTPLFLFGKITKQQYTYARHLKTIAVALEHKVKHVPMYAVAYRGPWKLIWNGFNDGSTAPPPPLLSFNALFETECPPLYRDSMDARVLHPVGVLVCFSWYQRIFPSRAVVRVWQGTILPLFYYKF